MTVTPEPTPEPRGQQRQEEALETGEVHQDAEGRRTTDDRAAAENADTEAERSSERLARGEVSPQVPEE
jgi:hypothetical protein